MINIMHHYISIIGPPQSKYILKSRRRFISHLRERNAPAAVAEMEELLRRAHRHYLSQLEKTPAPVNKRVSAA